MQRILSSYYNPVQKYKVTYWTMPGKLFGDYEKVVYIEARSEHDAYCEAQNKHTEWTVLGVENVSPEPSDPCWDLYL